MNFTEFQYCTDCTFQWHQYPLKSPFQKPLVPSCPINQHIERHFRWAAPKTSMKGFSIRVHVGNPPRKQNLHARKPRESFAKECVKVEPRKQRRKQVHSRSAFKYSCAPLFTGNFPRKQPRKILRNTCHRESQNCAREKTAKAVAKAYKD